MLLRLHNFEKKIFLLLSSFANILFPFQDYVFTLRFLNLYNCELKKKKMKHYELKKNFNSTSPQFISIVVSWLLYVTAMHLSGSMRNITKIHGSVVQQVQMHTITVRMVDPGKWKHSQSERWIADSLGKKGQYYIIINIPATIQYLYCVSHRSLPISNTRPHHWNNKLNNINLAIQRSPPVRSRISSYPWCDFL